MPVSTSEKHPRSAKQLTLTATPTETSLTLAAMASHHHHYHHHNNLLPPPCCTCLCCSPSPPPLPAHTSPSTTDPLLQIIATHLLRSHPPSHHYSQYIKTQQHLAPKEEASHYSKQTQNLFQSLIRRVAALETSLRHLSSSPPPHLSSGASSLSLRDVAARTIQTHFRTFLARRSRTLRYLKQLASIKSRLATLKSSLSDKTHFRPDVLSRKATDLLMELESIQGGDSMIQEGKKSIGAELVHFFEFVEGLSVRRRQVQSKPVRKVSFAEYANESRVFSHSQEQPEDEEEEIAKHCQVYGDQQRARAFLQKLSKENESHSSYSEAFVNEDEAQVELEGFHQISSGLSAPVPVQMEPRANDLMKKKKIVLS